VNGPASARFVTLFGAPLDHEAVKAKAHALFKLLDAALEGKSHLVGDRLTLANVAGYTYVAHAPEGGVSLEPYPNIRRWLAEMEAQPKFIGMVRSPLPQG